MSKILSRHAHAAYLEDFALSSLISGSGLVTADLSRRHECRHIVFINLASTSKTLLKKNQSTAGPRIEIDKKVW